ncbi:helix-turn-helix domain-containing protein [Candidatus Methanomassiliicoccus intestinalis]|jgi:hypothetical protein|uniref:Transcriptional regulator TrmB n=2 Tax=Candidatus Methanomassiliicoccus intestinalis TaxID=1406512 RepID=R9T5P3_METII|nr:TrmB family transcriptional regulator [Candidatus Methanomassiliicoccus intestinalis]AGN25894.1 transcriptional regulator TrmB [Candidatus Methanomassiliicoccus intestinalis Issoire-Mx1]TQS81218.1 MAG: hypothetical protein A3207_04930 [Candidatus Methanomassiliicoccus intestinalis]TQS83308.1 MAG: hypothetical protein A3206_06605 [Candidatus Methanomassiliicoccus intestinalis]
MRISDQEEMCILEAIRTANIYREELASSIIDAPVLTIVAATARRELTVREISAITAIPLATCYKIVEKMSSLGLLAEIGKVRTSTRGKASMYTTTLKCFSVDISSGIIEISITWKNGQTMNLTKDICQTVSASSTPAEEVNQVAE